MPERQAGPVAEELAGLDPREAIAEPLLRLAGHRSRDLFRDVRAQLEFLGAIVGALPRSLLRPKLSRAVETVLLAHAAGVEGLPIVGLINFLVGLIIAYVGGHVLATFGAQVFVADAIGIIMVREMAPIMTGILVAGRSGSAYAAELGTMKVNEEIDALSTMGLDPVPLLVLPRVLAGTLVLPLLSLYGMAAGILAGLLHVQGLGYPIAVGWSRLAAAVGVGSLVVGVAKSVVFGFLVAAVGCLRGLQTGRGASAVGRSATRAVVAGILLVIVVDAIFAVVTTALGV